MSAHRFQFCLLLPIDSGCIATSIKSSTLLFRFLQAPPELLLLTDVKDLENTLALYRVAVIFEALVPFQAADGTPIDVNQHRLSAKDAAFLKEHRSADISQTVLSASK